MHFHCWRFMKYKFVLLIGALFILSSTIRAQQVIKLPVYHATSSPSSSNKEKEYYSDIWGAQILTNVTEPTLIVYKPEKQDANRTSVIICPGGGYHALQITHEGTDIAKWLSAKGITAFILKYRLVPTGNDGVKEFEDKKNDRSNKKFEEDMAEYRLKAIADTKEAIKYVRKHASEFGVSSNRIGIMGLSVGGHIVTAVGLDYTTETRPDFVASIYHYLDTLKNLPVPKDAPPMFITAASEDNLPDAKDSIELYSKWIDAGKSVELHLYTKGGHSFGMKKQNLPSDTWIQRFYEWLEVANGKF